MVPKTIFNLQGQGFSLQGTTSSARPNREQFLPPFLGDGLLHFLLRFFIPPPHDVVQGENSDQRPNPPSTETTNKDFIVY